MKTLTKFALTTPAVVGALALTLVAAAPAQAALISRRALALIKIEC